MLLHFHIAVKFIFQFFFYLKNSFLFFYLQVYHYQITLKSGFEYGQTRGKISIILVGTRQRISVVFDEYVYLIEQLNKNFLFSDETVFKSGSIETRFIPLTINIGEITEVQIDFKKTGNWITSSWYSSSWTFTKVTVLNGDQQQRY